MIIKLWLRISRVFNARSGRKFYSRISPSLADVDSVDKELKEYITEGANNQKRNSKIQYSRKTFVFAQPFEKRNNLII